MAYLRQAAQSSENSQRLQDSTAPEPLLLFWGVPYYDYRIICSIFWGFLIINVVEYWEFRIIAVVEYWGFLTIIIVEYTGSLL